MENDAAFDLGAALDPKTDVWDAYDKRIAPREETRWSDYPKDFAAGLADVGANIAASSQYASGDPEGFAAAARRAFTSIGDSLREDLSPEYRRRQSLPFVAEPGEATVFDEPTYGAMMQVLGPKVAGSLGSFAAFIGATAAGTALGGPIGGRIAAGATGSALGGGGVLKDIYAESDKVSDERLAQIPMVKQLLDSGMDIKKAREEWNRVRIGALPLFNAALGLAASQLGAGAAVARGGVPQAGGRLGAGARTGLEESGTESIESLAEEFNKQWASISGGLQGDFAGARLINAPIEGGVVGALTGAGTGVVVGGGNRPQVGAAPAARRPPATPGVLQTDALEPDPAQAAALTTEVTTPSSPSSPQPPAAEATPVEPAPASPPPVAPVAEQAPPPVAPAPAAAADEPVRLTRGTIAETPETLQAQVDDLRDAIRPVVLFPNRDLAKREGVPFVPNAQRPPMPEGMKLAPITGLGVVYYNPAAGLAAKDFLTMNEATLSKLLNMSGTTKEDVLAAMGRGATPAAITVRRGDTPVVDAATSTETLAEDAAAIAAKARPGDTVEVRSPADVLTERLAAQQAPALAAEPEAPTVAPSPARPKPFSTFKPTTPRTVRSGGTFITPAMRRAYIDEMSTTDAQGRRIFPDMSDEAIRTFYEARTADRRAAKAAADAKQARETRAAQQELDAQRQEAAENEAPKAPIVNAPKKKGKAYQARVDKAREIIEANQPSDVERAGYTSGAKAEDRVKARAALVARLDKIISQARAAKVAIPHRWRDGTPDYLGWLRTILDAKTGIKRGKDTSAIIDRFLADEFYVSQGDFEAVKKRRRGEAEGKFGSGQVREEQNADTDVLDDEEKLGREREAMVEDEANPADIYDSSAIAQDAEVEADEAPGPSYEKATERPKIVMSENELLGEVVTQVRSREGEFKVERKGALPRPKIEGKISLKPKAAAAVEAATKRDQRMFLEDGTVPAGANVVYDTWESRQGNLDAVTPDGKKARKAFDDFDAYLENYSGIRSEAHNRAKEEFEFALRFSPDATVGEVLVGAYTNISAAALDADQTIRSKFAEFAAPVHGRMVDALRQYKYQIYKAIQNLKLTKEEQDAVETAVDAIDDAITKKTSAFDVLKVNDVLREQAPKLREEFALLEAAIDYSQALIDAINGTPSLRLPDYKTGKPAVFDAFHGTREFFARFAKDRLGSFTKSPSAKEAFFFARNPATSNSYSGVNGDLPERVPDSNAALDAVSSHFVDGVVNPDMLALYDQLRESDQKIVDDIAQQLDEKRDTLSDTDKLARLRVIRQFLNNAVLPTPNTIMARVYLKNPLVADFQGRRYREQSYYELILEAKRNGHDGVIMLNTYDGGPQDVIYAVFNENQISDRFNPERKADQIFPMSAQARREATSDYLYGNGSDKDVIDAFTVQTSTVGEMIRAVKIADLAKFVQENRFFTRLDQRLQRALAPQMLRALRRSVPNVQVKVLSDEGYGLVAPPNSYGFYDPPTDTIVLSDRALRDPKLFAWVIAHESAHAAFAKAVDTNTVLRQQLGVIMAHVRENMKTTMRVSEFTGEGYAENAPLSYGFNNTQEFIAEAWSNPAFQRLLASTELPPELANSLGVRERGVVRTLWDWLRAKMASVLGLPPTTLNAFDAVMKVSEQLYRESGKARATGTAMDGGRAYIQLPVDTQRSLEDLNTNLGGKLRRAKSALKTMTMIARDMVDGLWKGTDAPLRAAQLRRSMDVMKADILTRLKADKLITDHAILERANPELYTRMTELGYRYTVIDANPGGIAANKHMGNKRKYIQARAQLAALDAEFAAIRALDPRYTELLLRTSETFKDIQNQISLQEIKNLLDKAGVVEPGLAERIHVDGLTPADEKKFATNAMVKALNEARAFKKIAGLYLPEIRRGDFIVFGRFDLEKIVPSTAIQLDQDTLLFTGGGKLGQAERDAEAFLASTELSQSNAKVVYIDKNDPEIELEKQDIDAVPALRVRMQTQFTSFVPTEAEAKQLASDMKADGALDVRYQIKREVVGARTNVISADMRTVENSMKRSEKFKDLSSAQQDLAVQSLRELAVRFDGDGRLAHRRMKRRNVAGFSKDLLANTQTYLDQATGYLARLDYQPKIDAAVDEMDKFIKSRSMSLQDVAKMREQYNVLVDRLYRPELPQGGTANNIVRRLLQISMLNKLAGVSYNVINAHEPWLIAAPYMSGRFGVVDTVKAMGDAYKKFGVLGAVGRGIVDTVRAFRQDRDFTNFQDYFVQRYAATGADSQKVADMKDLFNYLHETGLFDREAGMEVTRVNDPSSNVFGRGLDRAELMFRQVAATIEAINRAVVASAAYELEYKKTQNHEAAKAYAYNAVHDTMGDYSAVNASPIFNSQLGRLALQFKKFAQKTYWLLGRTIAHAFKGDKEAMKQFAGLMFTTALVSGVLGLPLEPIKIALLASGALLGTGFSYDDFEDLVRRTAAGLFGVKAGEVFSRGLYRTIDVEVANRMGLDSLLTFGQPRSQNQQDLKAWLFDTAAGAPAGTVLSQMASLNSFMTGIKKQASGLSAGDDYLAALEKSMAPKAVTDIVKAYRGATNGKESASGRQTLTPYTPYETALKAMGFTPAREYEQQRLRASVTDKDREQQAERSKFNQLWYKAGPTERAKLWGQIEKWNKDRPKETRITRAQLDAYVKRRNTEEEKGTVVDGIRVNKNSRSFYDDGLRTYNTR